jgi:hypothetical protein
LISFVFDQFLYFLSLVEFCCVDGNTLADAPNKVESNILSMSMATKFVLKLVKNKRNQKNNLAMNFLLTNFTLIAKNNLNI